MSILLTWRIKLALWTNLDQEKEGLLALKEHKRQRSPLTTERVSNALLSLIYRLIPIGRASQTYLSQLNLAKHEENYLEQFFFVTDQFMEADDQYLCGKYGERTLLRDFTFLIDNLFYRRQRGQITEVEIDQSISSFLEENDLPSRYKNALLLDSARISELGGPKEAALIAVSDYFASEPGVLRFSGSSKNTIRKEIRTNCDWLPTDLSHLHGDFKGFIISWFAKRVLGVKKEELRSILSRAENKFDDV